MKIKFTLLFVGLCLCASAQQSFFETIKAHGTNAEYLSFGEVYINDDGKQQTSDGNPDNYSVKLHDYQGLPAGLKVHYLYEDKNREPLLRQNFNITKEPAIEFVGYPNTSMVHHSHYKRAYVAIDNYIFFLTGVSKDKLDFDQISDAIVVKGASAKAKAEKKKKKKGFGKFLKKVAKAATSSSGDPRYSQPSGPEYDALMSQDVKQMIKDYLKSLKAKQDAYTMTAKDKANLAQLKSAGKAYDDMVIKKNNEYWNSPEVKRHRSQGKARAAANDVTLKNTGSNTVWISFSGDQNKGIEVSPGSATTWDCKRSAYYQRKSVSGNTSSYASTTRVAYSANSKCGKTVDIN